ncbi:MAG: efflux RND transporter permease subunit [Deltaproteobacteria bacterium]|nr:efflux RND transporter permease subunit [Deltaproteobacteria bacterium]
MTLSDISIRRPVFTWVLMFGLVLFGMLGYARLGVDQFPDMEFPMVVVTARLDGASPEGIEEDVTDVLEEQLNGIAGVRSLRSTSGPSSAMVMVEFQLGTDIEVAVQDVRDKVGRARMLLPSDVEPPMIMKMDPGDNAILWMPIETTRPITEATEFVRRIIKPELETIDGVASVMLFGRRDRNIRIWLDDEELRARGLAANDVLMAIRREHVEIAGGIIESRDIEYTVKTEAEFESLEALENLIITHVGGAAVHLSDVARVEDGAADRTSIARFGGKRSLGVGIMKQAGGNTVAIADEAEQRIKYLNPILPADLQMREGDAIIDFAEPIRESVAETQFALIFGALLAVLTVFVFLRRWRPTLVVALAIPLSLVASFGVTWLFGYTLNTMTLLAMALAVGVVIDDAIVVLENIERHRENGEDPFEAAQKGTSEIAFAATAATVSIAVVFLPVVFIEGIVRNFLGEFGVTVASAVMISLFVALTLTPMLAARIPAAREVKHGSVYHRLERGFHWLETHYRTALDWTMGHRWTTLSGAALSGLISIFLMGAVGKEFFPPSDQALFLVSIETPPGSTLLHTERQMIKVERWLLDQPEVAGLFSAAGSTRPGSAPKPYQGIMAGTLVHRDQRERSVRDVIDASREVFNAIPGVSVRMFDMSGMMGGGGDRGELSLVMRGNVSLVELDRLSDELVRALAAHPGFVDVDKNLKLGMPEIRVKPDREKAAALGVDAASVAQVVRTMIGGIDVATFKEAGKRYDIRVRLEESDRSTPEAVERLFVRSKTGEVVELRNLVEIETRAAPTDISRTDRQRSVVIGSNLKGINLGEAVPIALALAEEILPEGVQLELDGQAEAMAEGFQQFVTALGLAILVIYLVLAMQFESFVHPFTVMLALPLAMFGALGGLVLAGMTLNLFSMIGILLLFGLVTKNSILLVDYANQLRGEGLDKVEAMRKAAPIRMRPVLMTAISMIFGVLPAAIGLGPGSESRAPMAVATAAGMFSSTLLTLLVVPVFYVMLDDAVDAMKRGLRRLLRRGGPTPELPAAGG